MNLNNKRKKYVEIDQNTESEKISALLDGMKSDLEGDIDGLMNDSNTRI